MKKIITCFLALIFLCSNLTVYADLSQGYNVTVSIESYDKNLARRNIKAFTFKEAIQKLAAEKNLELTFIQDGHKSRIYSVNGIENTHFGDNDRWLGCIVRDAQILNPDGFIELALEENDLVLLYYGDPEETSIISQFTTEEKNNSVLFTLLTEYTEWKQENAGWVKNTQVFGVENVKIHLTHPDGTVKILNTGQKGTATAALTKLGVYQYYGESYLFNHSPGIVRTIDFYELFGAKDRSMITRGEAAAFIVNTMKLEQKETVKEFIDVTPGSPHYEEIMTAVSNLLISGYGDGTFRPDESATMLDLCLMLSGLYSESEGTYETLDVPDWAQERINRLASAGILNGLETDWYGPVAVESLMKIYWHIADSI